MLKSPQRSTSPLLRKALAGVTGVALLAAPLALAPAQAAPDAAGDGWTYSRTLLETGATQGYQMGMDPVNRKIYFTDAQARTDRREKVRVFDAAGAEIGWSWAHSTTGGSAKLVEFDMASKTLSRNISYGGLTRLTGKKESEAHSWDGLADSVVSQSSMRTHFSPNGFAIDPNTTYGGVVDPTIITTHVRQQLTQADGNYGGGVVIFKASQSAPTDADRLWKFDDETSISDNSRRVAVNTTTHKAFITNMGTRSDARRGYVTVIDLVTKKVDARIAIPKPVDPTAHDGGVIGVAVDEANNYVYAGVITAATDNSPTKLFRIDASNLDTSNAKNKTLNAAKVTELDALVPSNARPFYSAADKRLYVSSYNAGIVSVVDADPASAAYGQVLKTIESGPTNAVTVDAERGLLYSAGLGDKVVKMYDTKTFELLLEIPTYSRANDLAVDPVTGELWVGYFSFSGADSTKTEVFDVVAPGQAVIDAGNSSSDQGIAGKTSVVVTDSNGAALAGTVTLSGAGAVQSAKLKRGEATFTLPTDLAAGNHTLTFAYAGSGGVKSASATVTHTVAPAAVSTPLPATKVASKLSTKAAKGTLTVTVKGAAKATGKVKVTFKKGKKTVKASAKVKNGKSAFKLRKLGKGSWKATVVYAGDSTTLGSKTSVTVKR